MQSVPAWRHVSMMSESAAQLSEPSAPASTARRVLDRVVETMGGNRRVGQEKMVDAITRAIEGSEHLLVQAGTGTGKSLGYLVPLLVHCARTGERALVTTATLALQRQILTKDAPAVLEQVSALTGLTPKIAVLKGWSNYLCLHRLGGGYPHEGTLFDDFAPSEGARAVGELGEQVLRLRQWAHETRTGDRDDLVPGVTDRAWRQVSVSKRECLGKACPLIEECFAQSARVSASEADLVVTNHSLFGIHCTGDNDLFTEVGPIIVDEAHELADRVRGQASQELSVALISRVARVLRSQTKTSTAALEAAGSAIDAALEPLETGLLLERFEPLVEAMRLLDDAWRSAASSVQNSGAEAASKTLARAALDEIGGFLELWSHDPEKMILSLSRQGTHPLHVLSIGPLDVAPALGLKGFSERPVILTSATLCLGGSFDAMARETGFMMTPQPWKGIDVGTPFEPQSQAIMYIAQSLPDPGPAGMSEPALKEFVDLALAAEGGVLGLFSSWRAAQMAGEALRERSDLEVYMQGEETLSALVDRFRRNRDSCLIGTLSLWQGVDVVGQSCRLVVIDRIPFPHKDDPVTKARSIDAERRGLSGFRTVSLTRAALLMAQGAGRLLRSTQDRGVLAILDRRLLTKSYGAFILESMPKMWPTRDPSLVRQAIARLAASSRQ